MVVQTMNIETDVRINKTFPFYVEQIMQRFHKKTGNNLIWVGEKSAAENASVCKSYNF